MNKGQSLFEVVIAIAVAALIMTGVASLATKAVRDATFARNKTQATRLAQEASEWLRTERDADWDTFVTQVGYNCLGSLSWVGSCSVTDTIFSREVTLTTVSPNVIEAVVVVTWDSGIGTHEVRSVTRFSDWR